MSNVRAAGAAQRLVFLARVGVRHLGWGRAGHRAAALLAAAGIAVGAATLIVVLAVMNGFQLGFIEDIIEIGSYHVRVVAPRSEELPVAVEQRLAQLPGVRSVVPFSELQGLAYGASGQPRGLVIRALPPDVRARDAGFARHVELIDGAFALELPGSIVLGAELAARLRVRSGQVVSVVALSGSGPLDLSTGGALTSGQELLVAGVFRSGFYEYDSGWGFVGPATAASLAAEAGGGLAVTYGLKIGNRFQDVAALRAIHAVLAAAASMATADSWRTFNRAFFAALRVEKLLMMAVIGLIVLVVAFNVLQALRRRVVERTGEIGLLRALGASQWAVRAVFVLEGGLVGVAGATVGVALGLLLATNIDGVFAVLETLVNAVLRVAAALQAGAAAQVSLFSPATFYLIEIPSRLLVAEVVLVGVFAVAAPAGAGLLAARQAARVRPAVALREE